MEFASTTGSNTNNSQSSLENKSLYIIKSIPNLNSVDWHKNFEQQRFVLSSFESTTLNGSVLELANLQTFEHPTLTMGNSHINSNKHTPEEVFKISNDNFYYNNKYRKKSQNQEQKINQQYQKQQNELQYLNQYSNKQSNRLTNSIPNNLNLQQTTKLDQILTRLQPNTNRRILSPSLTHNESKEIFLR